MSQQELLTRVVSVLDSAGIEYMLTGSFATSLHGEPRSTHDIDLVVSLTRPQADRLLREFPPPDFYLSESAVHEAIASRRMFNLLDVREGDKVDFWLLTEEPFDQSRFARRRLETVFGIGAHVSSPEDTILAKLKWCRSVGGSEKHFGDALRVFEVQASSLDYEYLESWTEKLGLQALWQRLCDEAEPIDPQR